MRLSVVTISGVFAMLNLGYELICIHNFRIYCLISMKFGTGALHIRQLVFCEFRENRSKKSLLRFQ